MNKSKLRELLEEMLPVPGEQGGPTRSEVLEMLRRERVRRRRRRTGVVVVALAGVLSIAAIWKGERAARPVTVVAASKPAAITIEHVDDEQLFSLLEGTPAALMEWPDGERTLLVVKH